MQHTFDILQVVSFLAAFIALASRLFVASRPFWSRFPAWVQTLLPVLAPTLTAAAQGLTGVRSWSDLSVLFVVSAGMLMPGLPSNRSAAPLREGVEPKLSPSIGDLAVAQQMIAKASVRPLPLEEHDMTPRWGAGGPLAVLLLAAGLALHSSGCRPSKPPCDQAKMAAIIGECTAKSQECVNRGLPEDQCPTLADCDSRIEKACGQ